LFSSDFIADLPVAGRFYQNVASLSSGVQDPDDDGNPNVNGARERDFRTQVGGVGSVDPLTGTFMNLVTSDSVEDLTLVTAGAGAEFGRAGRFRPNQSQGRRLLLRLRCRGAADVGASGIRFCRRR
jgi:hypothetical protein